MVQLMTPEKLRITRCLRLISFAQTLRPSQTAETLSAIDTSGGENKWR